MGSMKDQLGDDLYYPQAPGFVPVSTSRDAAKSMRGSVDVIRERVFDFIRSRVQGATCDEVEVALNLSHQTASARLRELELARRVKRPGIDRPSSAAMRKTRSGRNALIYVPSLQP